MSAVNNKESWFFTFGQNHVHRMDGVTFDCDIVVQIDGTSSEARKRMFECFKDKWSHQYQVGKLDMSYFPRGFYKLD